MNTCIPDLLMSFCTIGFASDLQPLDFTVVSPLGSTHIVEVGTTIAGSLPPQQE